MKKTTFFILALFANIAISAQNTDGNLHILNHDINAGGVTIPMDLYYTVHTIDPAFCGDRYEGTPTNLPLPFRRSGRLW